MRSVRDVPSTHPSSYTVLIVESVSSDRGLYCRCLLDDPGCHYTCLQSDSAAAALLQCQTHKIDGILVDYALVDATGLEFVQSLYAQFADKQPPVVMVGSERDPAIVVQAMKLGAENYLVKETLTSKQLQGAMKSAIDTDRLRLQLRQQEERFRISIENMLDCFGIFSAIRDQSGQILDFQIDYLNEAACENNRMTREMQIGQRLCELLPAHRETGLFDEYCQVVETGEPLVRESLVYEDTYDGQRLVRAFDIHANKLNDGFVASWRDVTDRKRLELELSQRVADLQQQQYRLQRLLDHAPIGIGIGSASGEVTVANDEMLRLHGYTREEFEQQGMNWRDFSSPDLAPNLDQVMERLRQEGTLPPEEKELVRRDGSIMPIWISAVQWFDGTEDHVAFAVDLTRQKRAQAAIERLNQELNDRITELQTLVDTIPVGIAIAFDPSCQQMQYNAYLRELLGVDPGRNISKSAPDEEQPAFQVFHNGQEVPAEDLPMQRAARLGIDIRDVELDIHLPDGTIRTLLSYATPLRNPQTEIRGVVGAFLDITERKRIEAALPEREEQLRLFIKHAPADVAMFDHEMRYILASDRWLNSYGIHENVVGRSHYEILPEIPDRWKEIHQRCLGGAIAACDEDPFPRTDGSVDWVRWEIRPWHTNTNDIGGIIIFSELITERKQAEARLQESQEKLRLGVQVAGIALATVNYSSNTVMLSPEAAALYGIADDELTVTRDRVHATFHPDDRERCIALIEQVLDPSGTGWIADEHRIIRQNGEVRWLSVRKQVFFDNSGTTPQPDYAILAAIDITERKQTEIEREHLLAQEQAARTQVENLVRQLAIEQNRLEQILQQMPVGVGIIEAPSGKVLFFNDEAIQIFRHPLLQSEVVEEYGQYGGIHPDGTPFQPEDYPVARSLLSGEFVKGEEFRYRRGDGTETIISVNSAPILDENEQAIAVVCTLEDIALRKQIEAERDRLLAEAEAANRSKDEFVSLVAHELRSPLNAIMGWARLLQTRSFDAVTTQHALETIARNTQVQAQLIEDLLDVSRMVRGTLRLEFGLVSLEGVVRDAVEAIRPTAENKGLQLITQIHATPPIQGDAGRLQQAVLNLLTNAVKFTPSGGRVQILLDRQDAHLQIQVSDTGKGISPNCLPNVFERFWQDQQSTTTKQGLGLGLAIVKYIIEQHGGTITAESQGKGQGATFTIWLPLLEDEVVVLDEVAPLLPSDATSQPLAGVKVLLVDDNPDMLSLTALVLEQAGAVVKTASNAKFALQELSAFNPDILISDISMPEQNGYELLQQVRAQYAEREIPAGASLLPKAIALTAYAGEAYREDSFRAGFIEHLTKPVEPEELVRVVLKVMQQRTR